MTNRMMIRWNIIWWKYKQNTILLVQVLLILIGITTIAQQIPFDVVVHVPVNRDACSGFICCPSWCATATALATNPLWLSDTKVTTALSITKTNGDNNHRITSIGRTLLHRFTTLTPSLHHHHHHNLPLCSKEEEWNRHRSKISHEQQQQQQQNHTSTFPHFQHSKQQQKQQQQQRQQHQHQHEQEPLNDKKKIDYDKSNGTVKQKEIQQKWHNKHLFFFKNRISQRQQQQHELQNRNHFLNSQEKKPTTITPTTTTTTSSLFRVNTLIGKIRDVVTSKMIDSTAKSIVIQQPTSTPTSKANSKRTLSVKTDPIQIDSKTKTKRSQSTSSAPLINRRNHPMIQNDELHVLKFHRIQYPFQSSMVEDFFHDSQKWVQDIMTESSAFLHRSSNQVENCVQSMTHAIQTTWDEIITEYVQNGMTTNMEENEQDGKKKKNKIKQLPFIPLNNNNNNNNKKNILNQSIKYVQDMSRIVIGKVDTLEEIQVLTDWLEGQAIKNLNDIRKKRMKINFHNVPHITTHLSLSSSAPLIEISDERTMNEMSTSERILHSVSELLRTMYGIIWVQIIKFVLRMGWERQVLLRLPNTVLVHILDVSLEHEALPKVIKMLAGEVERRIKDAIHDTMEFTLDNDFQIKAPVIIKQYIGKDSYQFGDITRSTLQRITQKQEKYHWTKSTTKENKTKKEKK